MVSGRTTIVLGAAVVVATLAAVGGGQDLSGSAAEPEFVSLIQLIAAPNEYHGKSVRVIGFCHLEFEGNALFLHRDDSEHRLLKNGLWLALEAPPSEQQLRLDRQYVLVEGVFNAEHRGHMNLFSGELRDIGRFERWQSHEDRESMRDRDPTPR